MFIAVHVYDAQIFVSVHEEKEKAIAHCIQSVGENFDHDTEDAMVFEKKDGIHTHLVWDYRYHFLKEE